MPMEERSDEMYEVIKTKVRKAQENGDFKTEITSAEMCGFYYHAGKISRLHGLFKRAYKNFKKGEKENPQRENCLEGIKEIRQTLNPSIKNSSKVKIVKIYEEKYDKGNFNKPFWSKTEETLINRLERNQERQNSYNKIRFSN